MWTYLYTISSFEPRCFLQRVNLPICNILSVWMVQQRCVWLLTCSRVLAQASLFSVIRRYPLWAKVGVWISQQVLLTHPWPVLTRISRRWKAALVFCFALSRISNFSFCFTPCVFFLPPVPHLSFCKYTSWHDSHVLPLPQCHVSSSIPPQPVFFIFFACLTILLFDLLRLTGYSF